MIEGRDSEIESGYSAITDGNGANAEAGPRDPTNESEGGQRDIWGYSIAPSRIEALVDGTFAIAMTILVLELSLDSRMINAIAMERPYNMRHLYIGLLIHTQGFVTLGIYWALHHNIFHFIKRSNGVLVWLNIAFLITATLVPLATKVNQVYDDSVSGFVFYSLTTLITLLLMYIILIYATHGSRLVDRDLDPRTFSPISNILATSSIGFIVILVLTYVIPSMSYLGFLPMVYIILSIATGRDRPRVRSDRAL